MTISVSITRIIDTVNALVALDRRTSAPLEAPEILNPDRRELLSRLCRDELVAMSVSLMPLVTNVDTDSDPDLMTIDISANTPCALDLSMLRHNIESTLALRILSQVWAPVDSPASSRYADEAMCRLIAIRAAASSESIPLSVNAWRV